MDPRKGSQRRDIHHQPLQAFSRFPPPRIALHESCFERLSHLTYGVRINRTTTRHSFHANVVYRLGRPILTESPRSSFSACVATHWPRSSAQARNQSTEQRRTIGTNLVHQFSKHRIPKRAQTSIVRHRQGWPGDTKPPFPRGA